MARSAQSEWYRLTADSHFDDIIVRSGVGEKFAANTAFMEEKGVSDSEQGRPLSLFRYQAVNPYTLSGLSSTSLYFSSPVEYNDPYDSRVADISQMEDEGALRKFVERYSAEHLYDQSTIGMDLMTSIGKSGEPLCKGAELALQHEREIVLQQLRICCFSELKNDMVLWSHYGDQHRGMCLEFDSNTQPFDGAERVSYVNAIPKFDFLNGYLSNDYSALVGMHRRKYSGWSYEKEWRIVEYAEPKQVSYYYTALIGVYLGVRMPHEWKNHIRWILSEFPPGERPRLFELSLDSNTFQLIGAEVTLYGSFDAYADDWAAREAGL
jgi:hypothetical protein